MFLPAQTKFAVPRLQDRMDGQGGGSRVQQDTQRPQALRRCAGAPTPLPPPPPLRSLTPCTMTTRLRIRGRRSRASAHSGSGRARCCEWQRRHPPHDVDRGGNRVRRCGGSRTRRNAGPDVAVSGRPKTVGPSDASKHSKRANARNAANRCEGAAIRGESAGRFGVCRQQLRPAPRVPP